MSHSTLEVLKGEIIEGAGVRPVPRLHGFSYLPGRASRRATQSQGWMAQHAAHRTP